MRKFYLLPALLAFSFGAARAQELVPAGGGGHEPPKVACLSPAQFRFNDSLVLAGIARLEREGRLPDPARRPAAVPLAWPLRQAPGFDYASYYGISNFVDRNPAFPNQTLDWNCGNRTYDLSNGYNHAGLDIYLWPFNFNMMDAGQVDVIAAAPGVIVAKSDNNFDRNCAMSNANWNAVYVQNTDGSVCWYGHLKSGSLTSKPVGAAVAQGEYLGKVGSSGSSTGPHLHFELHNDRNQVTDPYAGPCGPGSSWWATPKSYYEPTLNTLLTHSAPPVFAACPNPHALNLKTAFQPNDLVYFAGYYHDQQAGQVTSFTIFRPDNSVFASWNHSMTQAYFSSSYWYWSFLLPANAPTGTWRFAATYQGRSVTRNFTVGTVSATRAARQPAFALYPNPARQQLTVESSALPRGATMLIRTGLGQLVATHVLSGPQTTLPLTLRPGLYLVSIPGQGAAQPLVVE
ncbi:peptidoglycan DD-metalloendopeptidase family protein [Hymenobacter sp. B81]|uniref:peptidoglycan DD-metalloendopeptidase family protein n=1 Tax=Hymenobacter sp. B81 TaxID=3344878 RepID=UPI0037DD5EDF